MIKRYDRFIESRKNRIIPEGTYTEKHHKLPKCMGGEDVEDNLITLTAREHYIAHKMLYRENRDNKKLVYAFKCMCLMNNPHQRRGYKITSKDFEIIREPWNKGLKGCKHTDEQRKKIGESVSKPIKVTNLITGEIKEFSCACCEECANFIGRKDAKSSSVCICKAIKNNNGIINKGRGGRGRVTTPTFKVEYI